MKKLFNLMLLAVAGAAMVACSDVPAPYQYPSKSNGTAEESVKTLPYSESFGTSLGGFTNVLVSGSGAWVIDYSTAKASGYDNSSKVTTAGTYYLVSPEIDLTGATNAHVAYEYILRYNKGDENQRVLISTDYNEANPIDATWNLLKSKHTEGSDWTTFLSADITLPAGYMGQKVRVAFAYNTNATSGSTWEVKNFSIKEGQGTEDAESGDPTPSGDATLPYSEAFSSSLGLFSSVTTSGSGAWVIDYSTAKATGYDNASKVTTAGTYYLLSPEIDLTGVTSAHVSYEYILRYNKGNENQRVLISTDCGENPADATWTLLKSKHTEGSDWSTFAKEDITVPAAFVGKKVRVAFYYNTNATSGSTWEVKNFCIAEGEGTEAAEEEGNEPTPEPGGVKTLPYSEAFSSSLGSFVNQTTDGSGTWIIDYSTAKATGYANSTTTPGTYYLVSPEITLEGITAAHISYQYILRYNVAGENQRLLISTDYAGNAATATWTELKADHTEGSDWSTFSTADVNVPAEMMGKSVWVALYYNAPESSCSTWEVKNFKIQSGAAGEGGSEEGGEEEQGDDSALSFADFSNGDFETWAGSTPTNWQVNSAGNASVSQSTDAHSGSYSVCVGGNSSANKRLGYRPMTCEAGTYTVKFYVKAATSTGGSVRPGYVAVNNGEVDSTNYKYGDYVNDLTTDTWVEVTNEFTLAAKTTISIVVMNSKKPGADVLIDDLTITKN